MLRPLLLPQTTDVQERLEEGERSEPSELLRFAKFATFCNDCQLLMKKKGSTDPLGKPGRNPTPYPPRLRSNVTTVLLISQLKYCGDRLFFKKGTIVLFHRVLVIYNHSNKILEMLKYQSHITTRILSTAAQYLTITAIYSQADSSVFFPYSA